MIKQLILSVLIISSFALANENESDSSDAKVPKKKTREEFSPGTSGYPMRLINMHTPTTLGHGNYSIVTNLMPPGGDNTGVGLLLDFQVGLGDRLMLGLGYGGDGIVGRGDIDWYPWPSFLIKFRALNESYIAPAIAIGFTTSGAGGSATDYLGYVYKSKGLFIVVSKGFFITRRSKFDLHWDINYSLEGLNHANWPNTSVAIDFRLFERFTGILEYDFALNQQDISDYTNAKLNQGFFNLGFRWDIDASFALQVNFQDVFENRVSGWDVNEPHDWGREVRLTYKGSF